jgi:predicted peroxiredoxin
MAKVKVAFVCNGDQPSNLYPMFVLASAAAALGEEVIVFFTPGAAAALKKGFLEGMEGKGMPPMKDLVEGFNNLGGKMVLCELALEAKELERKDLREDIGMVGATGFMADIMDANVTFSF